MGSTILTTASQIQCPHGGQATLITTNTNAKAGTAMLLETDIHVTRDGVVVAFHDHRLDRQTDRRGEIEALTITEVECATRDFTSPATTGRSRSAAAACACHGSSRSSSGSLTRVS